MKAILCPICSGKGEISNFECRGCEGKGWIEVSESNYNPIRELKWDYPEPLLNKMNYKLCPFCGRDKNFPAGTGCPMGSHYGSYC